MFLVRILSVPVKRQCKLTLPHQLPQGHMIQVAHVHCILMPIRSGVNAVSSNNTLWFKRELLPFTPVQLSRKRAIQSPSRGYQGRATLMALPIGSSTIHQAQRVSQQRQDSKAYVQCNSSKVPWLSFLSYEEDSIAPKVQR